MTATPTDWRTQRVLDFAPVKNDHPKVLTQEQIAFYNANGYLKPFRVFSPAEADANRAYFDDLLKQVSAHNDGRDAYSINGYEGRCRGLYDLIRTPAILDYVGDLLGSDFVSWGTHFFCKLPGDPKRVAWHQDASYWPFTPSRTVTVWLAIDDADVENAAMRVIPGTHNRGHIPFRESRPDEKNVLNQTIENPEKFAAPVDFVLKAGEMSLHADMLVHGSEPNLSNRRRCGLTIRYCPVEVRSLMGWHHGSIICRGSDPTGQWANIPRPPGDDVNPPAWQVKPAANAAG